MKNQAWGRQEPPVFPLGKQFLRADAHNCVSSSRFGLFLKCEFADRVAAKRMTRRILIADDERMIADTLATILGLHGFEARTAYDGREAVENARQWRPHILLTDVLMPVMDGIDAAIAICRMLPECRIVLLSGVASITDLAGEIQNRGYSFEILRKPIPPEDLMAWLMRDGVAAGDMSRD